jgi:hypothetical protein
VSDDWEAVGAAVSRGLTELAMTPTELADLSGVSYSTILNMVNHPGDHHPMVPILRAISWELGWPPRYLEKVLSGHPRPEAASRAADDTPLQFLRKILVVLQRQVGDVVDVVYNDSSRFDITIEIKHLSREL